LSPCSSSAEGSLFAFSHGWTSLLPLDTLALSGFSPGPDARIRPNRMALPIFLNWFAWTNPWERNSRLLCGIGMAAGSLPGWRGFDLSPVETERHD
jgi:hypothetical protein